MQVCSGGLEIEGGRRAALCCSELLSAAVGLPHRPAGRANILPHPSAYCWLSAQPSSLLAGAPLCAGRQYALTYRPDSRKCYVLLKQGATPPSVVQVGACCCVARQT